MPVPQSVRTRCAVRARALCTALLASSLALGGVARAEDPKQDKSVLDARQKFRQAIALQTGGNWAGALALFRDVANVKNTPQVRFNIAICEENLGRLVQALGDYQLAAAQAREEGSLEVAGEVEGRLATLQARIPKVVIRRGANAVRAKISIDGVEVGSTMIGVQLPVDPGGHVVEAEARGFRKFEKAFEVAEKQEFTVEVAMEAIPAGEEPPSAAPSPADRGPTEERGTNYLPYIVGGVGAASLIASGVFFGLRQKAISDLDDACGPDGQSCPPSLEGTKSSGQTYSTVALVTLIAGVVGVGGGVTLLLLDDSPKGSGAGTALQLLPEAPLATAGASVIGRF